MQFTFEIYGKCLEFLCARVFVENLELDIPKVHKYRWFSTDFACNYKGTEQLRFMIQDRQVHYAKKGCSNRIGIEMNQSIATKGYKK